MNDLQIPGFEMIEKIGQGGMATVWKARQVSLDRIVAIKILSTQFSHDPSDVQQFQSEAQQAAKLKHAGIVGVYDANVEKGSYYFVMEYVAGYTVGDWVRRKGALSEKDAVLVCECVADALDHAWQKAGIIHCDIKPDNVIVDSDGSVKVADLGLSRTINAMSACLADKYVMGTPAYIAPEQAMGKPDLDCRADIYSLGAMLYHLVTGKMLFEGHADERIMELQVADTMPDAMDLNPKLSRNLCALMEKMLAKNKEDRQRDWSAVRNDLTRVKKGLPILRPVPEGVSTLKRSIRRTRAVVAPPPKLKEEVVGLSLHGKIGLAAVLMALIGAAILLNHGERAGLTPSCEPPSLSATRKVFPITTEKVVVVAADNEARRPAAVRNGEIMQVMKMLANETFDLVRESRFQEAARIYEAYAGPMAAETGKQRAVIVMDLKAREAQTQESRRTQKMLMAEIKMSNLLDRLTLELTTAGMESAVKIVNAALADEELDQKQAALGTVKSVLEAATEMDRKIIDGFKALRGQEVVVQLTDGIKKLMIRNVQDGKVTGQQKLVSGETEAFVSVTFEARDLSARERMARMGPEESAYDVALVKGLMAWNAKAYVQARKSLALTHPLLAERLVACVAAAETNQITVETASAVRLVQEKTEAAPEVVEIDVVPVKPVVLPVKHGNAGDVELIRNRLLDNNPEMFSRELVVQTDQAAGTVDNVQILSDGLVNIRAVAAFQDLKSLVCGAPSGRMCKLNDISAIRGLPLEYLRVEFAGIKDLSVLRGMALKRICIQNCPVEDLSPLKDMRTLEELQLRGTEVKDIAPLKGLKIRRLDLGATRLVDIHLLSGLPLESLDISDTQVKDIMVLKDMPLNNLNLAQTRIFNFSMLKGLSLTRLNVNNTQFRELALLKGMPLKVFCMENVGLTDLNPLRGHQIIELSIAGVQAKDYLALAEMPIRFLNLNGARVEDLAFVKNMPLENLDISNTRITDLTPLKGKSLAVLHINGTRIKDLRPLAGMALKHLSCQNTAVTNIEPLKGLPLKSINLDAPNGVTRKILRSMPELDYVNGLPFMR